MGEPEERYNRTGGESKRSTLEEIDFISPCPVQQCINKNEPITWVHVCGQGKMKLTEKGELRCINCQTQGLFIDWRFDCGDHDYEKASKQGIAHALAIMAQLVGGENEQLFIATVTHCIMRQFLNEDE